MVTLLCAAGFLLQLWLHFIQAEQFRARMPHLSCSQGFCPHLTTHKLAFQGDQGGLRTLQKKWTSFLKARLICSRPDSNLVFNVLRDIFVLRSPGLKEPVFYGVFTPQL